MDQLLLLHYRLYLLKEVYDSQLLKFQGYDDVNFKFIQQ